MDNRIQIVDYLPSFVASYKEIKAIMDDNQQELDLLWVIHKQTLDNNFVLSADEKGVMRYEKLLKILKNPNHSLDERKFAILLAMNKELPYTIRMIRKMLTNILGDENAYDLMVNNNEYVLMLVLKIEHREKLAEIVSTLRDIVPANLGIGKKLFMQTKPAPIYTAMHHTVATRISIAPYLPHDLVAPPSAASTGAFVKTGMRITIEPKLKPI